MNCERAEEIILQFCESKNGLDLQEKLEHHLDECQSCRTFVEELNQDLLDEDITASHEKSGKDVEKVVSCIVHTFYQ